MDKKELKKQIKDLNEVLNKMVEYYPNGVKFALDAVKIDFHINHEMKARICVREIKRRKLTNKFIEKFEADDIHEGLDIDIKLAKKKLENFDFTTKEKNALLKKYRGDAINFLRKNRGVID